MKPKNTSKAEWAQIKKEYLAGEKSMRQIAKEHNLAVSTISEKSSKEKWKQTAEEVRRKAEQLTIDKIAMQQASNAELASQIINKLIQKVAIDLESIGPGDTKGTKDLVQCMQQLRDMEAYQAEGSKATIQIGEEMDKYGD